MRDRLRAVNCPSDMIDQIGGWSLGKIGEGYGNGYKFEAFLCFMLQMSDEDIFIPRHSARVLAAQHTGAKCVND